jgi:ribosomal protein S18 acetylase RimI-like enzyme
LTDTNLFPPEMLGELIEPYFSIPDHPQRWFVCEDDGDDVVGFGFYAPEPLADGTWNLIALGVRNDNQGQGVGATMLEYVEKSLRGERVLIIETSGLPEYEATRHFYRKSGYNLEATIRDYWAGGDDKVIFWKSLGPQ